MDRDDAFLCTTCGHIGKTKSNTPGSMGIELILWLCLLIPGLIYSVWRLSRRHQACGACGAATILAIDAPLAKSFVTLHGLEAAVPPARPPSKAAYAFGRAVRKFFS